MHTVTAHITRRCRPFVASAVVGTGLALLSPAATASAPGPGAEFTQTRVLGHRSYVRASYGWPLKPFNRQHPVRAYLNDPRNGGGAKRFHFGIDISAPSGTAVYAVEAGQVILTPGRDAVAVKGATRSFGYWHITPAVRDRQLIRVHQLLGYICDKASGKHVHFAEYRGGQFVNPLRAGAIGPYVDRTAPTVASVEFLRKGQEIDAQSLAGHVDLVVEAFDTPPLPVPKPWSNLPVTPALVRWSVAHNGRRVIATRTAADFRSALLPPRLYDSIYAPGTRQNRASKPGHYRFYLAHGLDASRLPAGPSRLRIEAVDTRGNRVVAQVEIFKPT